MNCKNCGCTIVLTKEVELLGGDVRCTKCGTSNTVEVTEGKKVKK